MLNDSFNSLGQPTRFSLQESRFVRSDGLVGANNLRPTGAYARPISPRSRQKGVTLLIALIVLVIMTLAGIELMRSVDTTNIIAGNLAFQQAATHSGDSGIEAAIGWLEQQNGANPANLYSDNCSTGAGAGYHASFTASTEPPMGGATWDTWWPGNCQTALAADAAGNTVTYTINRMCSNNAGIPPVNSTVAPVQYCTSSPIVTTSTNGNSQTSGAQALNHNGQIYYRITARISGPRGTKSYVQAMVTM